MRIGFDAKRAFFNQSGLGNYSRTLLKGIAELNKANELYVYSPVSKKEIGHELKGVKNIFRRTPSDASSRMFPALWRSSRIVSQLKQEQIDLYHGLSNELPLGIENSGIPSLVTIHDVIFMHYPEYYPMIDRAIYEKKTRNACKHADKIVAISEATKDDLVHFFGTDPEKIQVIYQLCDPIFNAEPSEKRNNNEQEYLLYFGGYHPRKNIENFLRAYQKSGVKEKLVLVNANESAVESLLEKTEFASIIDEVELLEYLDNKELVKLLTAAKLTIYPSLIEGFGLPVLEAMAAGSPVLATDAKSIREAGGTAAAYVDTSDVVSFSETISNLLNDAKRLEEMGFAGRKHYSNMSQKNPAETYMELYHSLLTE